MATMLEHMQADYAKALEEGGQDCVIDGETIRCFIKPVEITASEFERAVNVRQEIFHLAGALETRLSEQGIVIDDIEWIVVSHTGTTISSKLIVQRPVG